MRVKLLLAVGLLAFAAAPVAADDVPVNYTIGSGGHVGIWVDGTTTTNHPYELNVDRSGGVSNVLTWKAPLHTDGRVLVQYNVYRVPNTPSVPVVTATVAASSTSYTDAAAVFSANHAYVVTATFEDVAGVFTESLPSNIAIAFPSMDAFGYPYCQPIVYHLNAPPFASVQENCVYPPPV